MSRPVEIESWTATDPDGNWCIHQRGIGHVIAIHAVGTRPPGKAAGLYRVDICLETRDDEDVVIAGHIRGESDLHRTALWAIASGVDVEWSIRYRRHRWIPPDVPIGALRSAVDMDAEVYFLDAL